MAKNRFKVDENKIRESWQKYNLEIGKLITEARRKGEDISWQFQDRITDYEIYREAWKRQKARNITKAEHTSKKWAAKENITRQLVKKARTFNQRIVSRYAKGKGVKPAVAKQELRSMSRQQLWDIYLEMAGGDKAEAAKIYRAVVYGKGDIEEISQGMKETMASI